MRILSQSHRCRRTLCHGFTALCLSIFFLPGVLAQTTTNPINSTTGHYYLPADFDGTAAAVSVSSTARVPDICSKLEGLDLVRAFTGATSCKTHAGARALSHQPDAVLLIDDTKAMSQYLLTMLQDQSALQEVADRAVVKPSRLEFSTGTTTLHVLVVGETSYATGLSVSGWYSLLDGLSNTPSTGAGSVTVSSAISTPAPAFPFIAGRAAHNHKASAKNWAKVQADASSKCASLQVNKIDCACATMSPENILNWGASPFILSGSAQTHFDHYAAGSGNDLNVDAVLKRMLASDSGVKAELASQIKSKGNRGHFFLRQKHYGDEEFHNAFGGIDRVDYRVDPGSKTVEVWFKDRYDFHPVGFGYKKFKVGDVGRNTNCVHAAAVEMKRTVGAADFWMYGHAKVKQASIKGKSSGGGSGSDDID